jgi:hypothetical protein
VTEVPDFCTMYELYDPCTVMFFYKSKHVMIDIGTGNRSALARPSAVLTRGRLAALQQQVVISAS